VGALLLAVAAMDISSLSLVRVGSGLQTVFKRFDPDGAHAVRVQTIASVSAG